MKGEMSIVEIKIIGINTYNGQKLKEMINNTMKNSDIDINLIEINSSLRNNPLPILFINNTLVCQGRMVDEHFLKRSITLLT